MYIKGVVDCMDARAKDFEGVRKLIVDAEEDVEFGEGVPQSWIDDAEQRIGVYLPETYKWWLLNYGSGELYGDEVYGLYGLEEFDGYSGDIVYQYEYNIENGMTTIYQLPVFNMNGEEYYFDLSQPSVDFEYPIYSMLNTDAKYASNFLEFLKKQITTSEI